MPLNNGIFAPTCKIALASALYCACAELVKIAAAAIATNDAVASAETSEDLIGILPFALLDKRYSTLTADRCWPSCNMTWDHGLTAHHLDLVSFNNQFRM